MNSVDIVQMSAIFLPSQVQCSTVQSRTLAAKVKLQFSCCIVHNTNSTAFAFQVMLFSVPSIAIAASEEQMLAKGFAAFLCIAALMTRVGVQCLVISANIFSLAGHH